MERDIHYRLIKEIEPYPVLYNFHLPDYTNKSITDKYWIDVAKKTGISVGECKEKWRNIRSSYIRSKKSPFGRARPKKIYYLARHLAFVEPFLKSRDYPTNNKEEEQDDTDNQSQDCNFDVENSDEYNEVIETCIQEEYIPEPETVRQHTVRTGKRRTEADQIVEVEYAKKKDRREEVGGAVSHPMHYFFLSLLHEFDTMDESQLRQFKIKVLQIIEEIKAKKPQASFAVSSEASFLSFQGSPAYASRNKSKKVPSSSATVFLDDSNTEANAEDVDIYVKLENDANF